MSRLGWVLGLLLLASDAWAGSLTWDYAPGTVPPTADVQVSSTATGPWTTWKTVPALPSKIDILPDHVGYFRVVNLGGVSNVVQVAPPPSAVDLTPRVTALEAAVTTLQQADQQATTTVGGLTTRLTAEEAATAALKQVDQKTATDLTGLKARLGVVEVFLVSPSTNLKVGSTGPDFIDITGMNCTSLVVTGTGVTRRITCLH